MTQSTLDARLAAAAEYVRQGAVFADIGTDHAHLPIYLLECGRITQAVAADIAQGPLSRAQENASEHGLSDKIIFRQTDGGNSGKRIHPLCPSAKRRRLRIQMGDLL